MSFLLSSLSFDMSSNSVKVRPIIFAINSRRGSSAVSYVPTKFPFLRTVILSAISYTWSRKWVMKMIAIPRCFSLWLAGGGIKGGTVYGETDDFSYNAVENPVHVNDLNATILHCLGIHNEKLSFKFQGLDQRLTGVEEANPVRGILA